jgi:hypothetical protein
MAPVAVVTIIAASFGVWRETRASLAALPASVSVGDITVVESGAGAQKLSFPVTLSEPVNTSVSVSYVVRGITATAGADFKAASGSVVFAPTSSGMTPVEELVGVTVSGDTLTEPIETFSVNLWAPSNGLVLGRAVATGTILDTPSLTQVDVGVGNASIVEGNASSRSVYVPVSLSKAPGRTTVKVPYTVAGATATAGIDFGGALSGTLSFSGSTIDRNVAIPIFSNTASQSDRTLRLTLGAATGAVVARAIGTVTILDDDNGRTWPLPPATVGIRVVGGNFVSATGAVVQLHGVNRPGTEYACTSGTGFVSGDKGDAVGTLAFADQVAASVNWPGINAVRVPLNEDCWLGINGAKAAYAGTYYRTFILRLVTALTAAGKFPILDLHWAAPGGFTAYGQGVAPDDHSVAFWKSVARIFQPNPAVIFDLYNEPRLNCGAGSGCPYAASGSYSQRNAWIWNLYRNGGSYTITSGDRVDSSFNGTVLHVAGTQSIVNAIRGQHAKNAIAIEGLGYGNSLDVWAQYVPTDSAGQLVVSAHQYPNSGAQNTTTPTSGWAGHYPFLLGEFGEWDCGATPGTFAQAEMTWADSHTYSWTAWGWDAGEGCNGPTLVTSDETGNASVFGSVVRQRLAAEP